MMRDSKNTIWPGFGMSNKILSLTSNKNEVTSRWEKVDGLQC